MRQGQFAEAQMVAIVREGIGQRLGVGEDEQPAELLVEPRIGHVPRPRMSTMQRWNFPRPFGYIARLCRVRPGGSKADEGLSLE
jgi:hypothetical protein